jgi:hypothetical protein
VKKHLEAITKKVTFAARKGEREKPAESIKKDILSQNKF